MVNQDPIPDPAKALEFKEKGNKCFLAHDYTGAEALYSEAIAHDPTNPLLYTNRAMSLLKLHEYDRVIADSQTAISLLPNNMKAYFQLAQAQIALHHTAEALQNAKKAHEFCVEEIKIGGKGASSLQAITEVVLRCLKEDWERREQEREQREGGLVSQLVRLLESERDRELAEAEAGKKQEIEESYMVKIEDTRKAFEKARVEPRRKVPDWVLDDITFSVMIDPVVTKTGQSYDRSSIMEHLKRSPTDPLTREPLLKEDLRPNLALRTACEEYLHENGWAVDW